MRRRLLEEHTGLGNPSNERMDGKSTGDKKRDALIGKCAKDAYKTFFKGTKLDYEYCDAQARGNEIRVGIEPAYMYQRLKMISIQENKRASYIENGYSWEAYGSGIRSTRKYYVDYMRSAKFTRFIDKWHPLLFDTESNE